MTRFALIGAAGFVAPRHLQAIHAQGGELVAALDPHDAVGVLDRWFPDTHFFTEFERFDRHLHLLSRSGQGVDYVSVCSPNYLHDAHARFAMRSGCDAICEKPLVLTPKNLDGLAAIEQETGQRVWTILQLRLHPAVAALKARIDAAPPERVFDVDLTYITARGRWYAHSWKGDPARSGGVTMNIGVHFFDLLHHLFGECQRQVLHHATDRTVAGYLEYECARVRWFLSIDRAHLPKPAPGTPEVSTYRSLAIDGESFEFSGGFEDLHAASYAAIMAGSGYSIEQSRSAIDTVDALRHLDPTPLRDDAHPDLIRYGLAA